ncbi:uncharacterized protein LOC112575566 [Pomacea canaliculata]|uniref:uncharacterized protein LOC112575566 n=1 Tax=Pomacea canaliculata TaxID=400727 RepID=UPI000D729029|nr:uncharacterized protein LOC112575566 [Pomacea canaliculata]XP_025113298.1 uncharacterized protein LOC112575566 [Pomacea canaliculata]XP_025113299.1 uncharacterized protein LOC112575566 [Pomacea canaliculata]
MKMFGILMIPLHRGQCPSLHLSLTQLAILVSCLSTAGVLTQDSKITCNATSVKPLEDAVMTCHFPEDLSVSKKDFTVYHYDKSESPEAVIDCWWLKGKLDCYAPSSIEYNKTVGTDLTLVFKHLTTALTGRYTCQVAGYRSDAMEPCEIQFQFEKENLCKVDYKNSESKAVLTCLFNEDLANTRRNFTVYKHNGQDKEIVVECSWMDGQTKCRVQNGYQYNNQVSSYLFLEITELTKLKEENYSCWHSNSESLQQKTCSLYSTDKERVEPTINTLAIGLSLGLLMSVILVACWIILRNKRRIQRMIFRRKSSLPRGHEEEGTRILDRKETTRIFQEYLEEQVKRMYPDMLESHHFVPSVYFNKIRYKPQSVAGEVAYVPHPCDPSDVQHDRAMQHVLHCLHYMAEKENERMFVLTQFQYDNYLNNPGNKYEQHSLPVPSGLKNVEKQVGCFDLLIVHRVHGVLAGVVKSVGNMENQEDEETTDERIASQVTEAVKQLRKAEKMLKHLMQDVCSLTKVGLTLILPNLTRSSLQHFIEGHKDLEESLRGCLGEDPIKLSLCSDDLSDPRKPWEVNNDVSSNIFDSWKWTLHRTQDNDRMNDALYLKVISRFFGPATQSTLQVPGEYEHFVLPKTLSQAISLTGDLYGHLVLPADTTELLQQQKLFFAGPPNSGKTAMLTLAGCQWLSQGHDVYIVSDISSKCHPVLANQIKSFKESQEKEKETIESTFGCTRDFQCDFSSDKSVNQSIQTIVSETKGKRLCVLLDGVHLDSKRVQKFCEALNEQVSDLYLWVTWTSKENLSAGYTLILTTVRSCPPAVLREVKEAEILLDMYENLHQYPTDGPTVKHFSLKRDMKSGQVLSNDCIECGKEVGQFLTKLLITGTDDCNMTTIRNELTSEEVTMETFQKATPSWTGGSPLQLDDILILFEFSDSMPFKKPDVEDDHSFLKGLREAGVAVRVVSTDGNKVVAMDDSNTAWAMHIRHMETLRVRRKIIVYLETGTDVKDVETKQRALKSCTSQLVLVHSKQV